MRFRSSATSGGLGEPAAHHPAAASLGRRSFRRLLADGSALPEPGQQLQPHHRTVRRRTHLDARRGHVRLAVGYEYGLTYFEDSQFRDLSTNYNQVNTRGRWRFLPRTAFLYDGSITFLRYNQPPPGRLDSDPVRARLGLNGLITPSFALLGMVGWGSSFYSGGPDRATVRQRDRSGRAQVVHHAQPEHRPIGRDAGSFVRGAWLHPRLLQQLPR